MVGAHGLAGRIGLVDLLHKIDVVMESLGVLTTVTLCLSLVRLVMGDTYLKVRSTFPGDISKCLLKEVRLSYSPKIACAALCSQTPNCTLFCLQADDACSLFSARVSQYWGGMEKEDHGVVSYPVCYSSWAKRGDMANLVTNTSAKGYEGGSSSDPEQVLDGYFCRIAKTGCYIAGKNYIKPWWMAEFPTPTVITALRIQAHASERAFSNVTVFIGNSSDINKNTEFAAYPGAALGQAVYLKGSRPTVGRYLFIQTETSSVIIICEVQIF